jgi:hypothetical protein
MAATIPKKSSRKKEACTANDAGKITLHVDRLISV